MRRLRHGDDYCRFRGSRFLALSKNFLLGLGLELRHALE